MTVAEFRTTEQLEAGVRIVRESPSDVGTLEMIVRRPAVDEREVIEEGRLDLEEGLVGDTWRTRGSSSTPDGTAHPDAQLTIMNARAADLVAGTRERWALAGDQLYVDFDLSEDGLPAGSGAATRSVASDPDLCCPVIRRSYRSFVGR